MKKKLPSLAKLKRDLDKAFSKWVRQGETNFVGMGNCVSCGTPVHWKEANAGHFIKRQHLAVRYDPRNVHLQCVRCNLWLHGNEGEYCLALVKRYGQEVVDELMRLKRTTVKMTRSDYLELLERYSNEA